MIIIDTKQICIDQITNTKVNDIELQVVRQIIKNEVMSDTYSYYFVAMQYDDAICMREFDTLSKAFNAQHEYLMHIFADSVYAIDDCDENAYTSFR